MLKLMTSVHLSPFGVFGCDKRRKICNRSVESTGESTNTEIAFRSTWHLIIRSNIQTQRPVREVKLTSCQRTPGSDNAQGDLNKGATGAGI